MSESDEIHSSETAKRGWVDVGAWAAAIGVCVAGALAAGDAAQRTSDAAGAWVEDIAASMELCDMPELPRSAADGVSGATPPWLVSQPEWARRPRPDFPEAAYAAGDAGAEGAVQFVCRVGPAGRFEACSSLSETPAGLGFEQAARRSLCAARLQPRKVDGQATAAIVRFNVRFRLADPADDT